MVEEETTTGTPTADIYLVQDGDTLIGIALKFNMNVHYLKRLNNLSSNVLYPGQVGNRIIN